MEIVLLYKFYILSFLNLKEGGREEWEEAVVFQTRAQLLPGKWHAHVILTDSMKDASRAI